MLNNKKTSAMNCGSLFAIADERLPERYAEDLKKGGFSLISLPPSPYPDAAVASHTDIILFRHMATAIGSRDYFKGREELLARLRNAGLDIRLANDRIGERYPSDAIFNALTFGKRIFCRKKTVSHAVLEYAEEMGFEVIDVNQGYPACTVLPIGDRIAITSDRGMAKALSSVGIEVITVPESDKIFLPPYKNGFIGGCAGAIGRELYFMGDPFTLPYGDVLARAAESAGVHIHALGGEGSPLLDLGGIIFTEGFKDNNGNSRQEDKPCNAEY